MSDVSNNTLQPIQEYFEVEISVDDFVDLEDRQAYLEALYADKELSQEQISEFEKALEDEIVALHDQAYVSRAELQAILDSGNLSTGEAASVELLLKDLDELITALDEDEILDEWQAALDSHESKNVELSTGESYTIESSDMSNGDTYEITASEEATETGSQFDAGSAEDGYWDTDNDGVLDTHWDQDGDGIADEDFNNDNVIDELDNAAYVAPDSRPAVTIELEEGDSLSLSTYEAGPPEVATFKVEKENGDVSYITITGDVKIVAPVPENLATMPTDLTSRMYEGEQYTQPYSFYTDGISANDADNLVYQTTIEMKDQDDNEIEIHPSSEDYQNEREYTVNMESGTTDIVELDLDDDAEIEFSTDENHNIILTVTTDEGTITIHLVGFEYGGEEVSDSLIIDGGVIDESDYQALDDIIVPHHGFETWGMNAGLFSMITYNDESLEDKATDDGFTPSVYSKDFPTS